MRCGTISLCQLAATCKAQLVTSLTHISSAIKSVQTFTFTFACQCALADASKDVLFSNKCGAFVDATIKPPSQP